jgi:hypothetical protein
MASDTSPWRLLLIPLRIVFWLIELPDALRAFGLRREVWRQAQARAPEVMAGCKRPRTIEPAELRTLKLPSRGYSDDPLPAGWRYTLATVVASVAQPIALEDHYGHPVTGHHYQGVLGFFDDRQALRLVRLPFDFKTTAYSVDRADEQHFRVGRHFVIAFSPGGGQFRLFAEVRPLGAG